MEDHNIRDEDGQGLAEYSMILSSVSIVAIVALSSVASILLNLPGWNPF